ncbi:hypothetical protein DXG01_015158 [Tephrocybe rancida]|nr:hypothetical protein DXG01_015158 [Tephrocybe rancida]
MSSHKYADLPDIDTAPDVYETEDTLPASQDTELADEEDEPIPARGAPKARGDAASKEEIDASSLIAPDEASRRFRRAERKQHPRTQYTSSPSPPPTRAGLPTRLHALQAELVSLEAELADPSNPALQASGVDAGELIRGLVDVRGRLERIKKGKEGRGRLVGAVLAEDVEEDESALEKEKDKEETNSKEEAAGKPDARNVAEMDRRVGELEKLVGSSSASLDDTSPLPPPLLPLITRLNAQLTLLAQPRHIDSISRRLKLLLSDLERVSSVQKSQSARRPPSPSSQPPASDAPSPSQTLLPLLTSLSPALPQIPHILARLRTLAALHTSAADFHSALQSLEAEQHATHDALKELESAVARVESSLGDNREVVRGNVRGLESRVDKLLGRLEELGRPVEGDA